MHEMRLYFHRVAKSLRLAKSYTLGYGFEMRKCTASVFGTDVSTCELDEVYSKTEISQRSTAYRHRLARIKYLQLMFVFGADLYAESSTHWHRPDLLLWTRVTH